MKNKDTFFSNILADTELNDSFSISYRDNYYCEDKPVCRITYNRIFFITEASGSIFIDDKVYAIQGNELFLLAKGQLYSFAEGTVFNGYELCFGDCFWDKTPASANNCKAVLFNNASANQHIPLSANSVLELSAIFNILFVEFCKAAYINKIDVMAAYLKIIMIKIANLNALLSDALDSNDSQLYRRFLELVSKSFHTTHEVAGFALQLSITARKLSDICNKCGGKGAKDIINGQLIAEAKRSLQFSTIPVKEIAYKLNFSTPDQFSHFFKKNAEISPNLYRSYFVKIGM